MTGLMQPARAGAYSVLGGRERRWRPPARQLLAVLLVLEALLAIGFAALPPDPTNRPLDAALAGVLAFAALSCAATWRRRGRLLQLKGCLVVAWGVPLVIISTRGTEASQLMWAAIILLVAVIAAFYLPPRTVAYQVGAMVVGYLIAALAFDPPTRPLYAAGFVVLMVLATIAAVYVRTDRDRLLESVAGMATTDPLTGLLNRRGLEDDAPVVHANAARSGLPTVVVLADLDGLKQLNDTKGHEAGDALIRQSAAHWRTMLRTGDLVARVGGDEFVLVLPNVDQATAGALMSRIRQSAPGPWSHGWTEWDDDEPLADALERADALMYSEKAERKAGRGEGSEG